MKALMKTTKSATPYTVEKKWHLIDADGLVVGRLASLVANILRGKTKPSYTPHIDCGDNVIIINAAHIVLFTGQASATDKVYYNHTGYASVASRRRHRRSRSSKVAFPERVVEKAIERMIPRGPLGRVQIRKPARLTRAPNTRTKPRSNPRNRSM